ncbi:MAG: hypothetical protein Q9228_000548 [Teloschistes exilis]
MATSTIGQRFNSSSSVHITPSALKLDGLMVSDSTDTDDMWKAYSEHSQHTYQGLDREWMQGSASGSEASIGLDTLNYQADSQELQSEPRRASHGWEVSMSLKRSGQNMAGGREGSEGEDSGFASKSTRFVSSNEFADMTKNAAQDSQAESCNIYSDTNTKSCENRLGDERLPNERSKAKSEGTGVGRFHAGPGGLNSQQAIMDALEQQTEELLCSSPQSHNRAASLPGVEAAKKQYDQGLLSTKTFHRDCLPPALLCSRIVSSSKSSPDTRCPTITQVVTPPLSPTSLDQHKAFKVDGSSLIVKRRNASEQQQARRNNQQPLSAIYEEPAGLQPSCACDLCSDVSSGRGIVWFHLCPRYAAMAREKGIRYEPYEGRVILHHGPNKESVGLIIEGPMEDRFLPAGTGKPTARAMMEGYLQSPVSETQSAPSATNHSVGLSSRTASSKALQTIPMDALDRSTTPVSQSMSTNSFSSEAGLDSDSAQRSREDGEAGLPLLPPQDSSLSEPGLQPSQTHIHPAFRNGGAGPQEWSRPPTKSQSLASFRQHLRGRHQSVVSEGVCVSVDYTKLLKDRPIRIDSLGAPAYSTLSGSPDACSIHSPTAPSAPRHVSMASQSTGSSSFLLPSAGHQRVPSTFLAPSTPSTASFLRSSTSSYDSILPPAHLYQLRQAEIIAEPDEIQRLDSFRSSEDSICNILGHAAEPSFSPESYHTASASHGKQSPRVYSPPTVLTTPTSASVFPSKDLTQEPPLSSSHGYLRPQASKHSFAQSFTNPQPQTNRGPLSRSSPLSADPLANAESTASSGGGKNVDHEDRYSSGETPGSNSVYSNDPLLAANLITAHDISISNSFGEDNDRASEQPSGLGITSTSNPTSSRRQTIVYPFTNDRIIPKPSPRFPQRSMMMQKPLLPDLPRTSSAAGMTDELELYVTRVHSPAQRPNDRLRTSLYVQQNLCTHPKLQSTLGVNLTGSPSWSPNAGSSPSMTMNEVLVGSAAGKEKRFGGMIVGREGLKGVVKKGSRRVMEGGTMLKEKVKSSWRTRAEDFLDLDD